MCVYWPEYVITFRSETGWEERRNCFFLHSSSHSLCVCVCVIFFDSPRVHVCISAILVIPGRSAFHIGNVYYVDVLFCETRRRAKKCNISSFAATDDIRWKCRQMNLVHSLCIFQLFHRAACRHLCTLPKGSVSLCVGLSALLCAVQASGIRFKVLQSANYFHLRAQ